VLIFARFARFARFAHAKLSTKFDNLNGPGSKSYVKSSLDTPEHVDSDNIKLKIGYRNPVVKPSPMGSTTLKKPGYIGWTIKLYRWGPIKKLFF
jgi:hypothetical protein